MHGDDERATVCLNMIVRDEAPVIARCLESVRPLIDHWVIVDTGSEDGTRDIVRASLEGVPGELHERAWRNFGHNRSEAVALAEGRADYLLTIDADETLERAEGFGWRNLAADAYLIEKRRGPRRYWVSNLLRSGLGWRWVGAVHEYPESARAGPAERLAGVAIVSPREGARSRDPLLYRRDALMLEQALLEDPDNARDVFYLAQSYRDADDPELAIRHYRRRAAMGGWHEEVFVSLHQIARLKTLRGDPWPECLDAYLAALSHTPGRAEPLYEIGLRYARERDWPCAWLFLERAAATPRDESLILFLDDEVYAWRARLEASVAAYHVDEHASAIALGEALLGGEELPERLRGRVAENLRLSREALEAASSQHREPLSRTG